MKDCRIYFRGVGGLRRQANRALIVRGDAAESLAGKLRYNSQKTGRMCPMLEEVR